VGPWANDYDTVFNESNVPNANATIFPQHAFGSPAVIPVYAFLKDGKADPNWYLFRVEGWNQSDSIRFQGFFLKPDATGGEYRQISHVALYGVLLVPDGGSMLAMLGMGLIGLAAVRRMIK